MSSRSPIRRNFLYGEDRCFSNASRMKNILTHLSHPGPSIHLPLPVNHPCPHIVPLPPPNAEEFPPHSASRNQRRSRLKVPRHLSPRVPPLGEPVQRLACPPHQRLLPATPAWQRLPAVQRSDSRPAVLGHGHPGRRIGGRFMGVSWEWTVGNGA